MRILLIATTRYLPLNALQCLHNSNIKIYVLGTGKILPIRLSKYCKDYQECRLSQILNDDSKLIERVNLYCRKNKIDVILPSDPQSTFFISRVRQKIKNAKVFPVSDIKTVTTLNNKWEFTRFLKKNSLPHPESELLKTKFDLRKLKINFPIIIKPLELNSGLGVKKLYSSKEAINYISKKNEYNSLPLIAQKFINGYGIDVSFLAKNGKIVALTIQKSEPNGSITFVDDLNVVKIINKITRKIKYTGIAHIDMVFDTKSKSIKILEFNPRFWGSMLGSKLSGVNFPYLGILLAQNKNPVSQIKYKKTSYITAKIYFQNVLKGKKKDLPRLSKSDFWQMTNDPLPYTYLFILEIAQKLKTLFKLFELSFFQ